MVNAQLAQSPERDSAPFDRDASRELDRVEAAIKGVEAALRPLWTAARTSPTVARVVAEVVRAMVDLRLERAALEERLGL